MGGAHQNPTNLEKFEHMETGRHLGMVTNERIIISNPTFKYHVFAPMGRFQLELIYLYFPPSFHQAVVVSVL